VFTGRVVLAGEPQWLAFDTALAVTLQVNEAMSCAGCGQDRRESLDPETETAWTAEAVRCHSCAARDRASTAWNKDGGSTAGLNWVVNRKGEP
jgi:hypothetical protein